MGAFTRKRQRGRSGTTSTASTTLFPRLKEREKQKGGTMSGGEQQMLAIGRALMAQPEAAAARRAVARPRAGDRRQDLRDHPRDQRAGHDDPARRAERQLRARRLDAAATCSRPATSRSPTRPRTCATTSASRPRTWGPDMTTPRPRRRRRQGLLPAVHLAGLGDRRQRLSERKGYGEKCGPRHRAAAELRRRDHLAARAAEGRLALAPAPAARAGRKTGSARAGAAAAQPQRGAQRLVEVGVLERVAELERAARAPRAGPR